ncbi:adenylate cyclase type 10-like [Glandiceps talaboti]
MSAADDKKSQGRTAKESKFRSAKEASKFRPAKDSDRINQIVTHIPDVVIKQGLQKKLPYTKPIFGVLMFADVSGHKSRAKPSDKKNENNENKGFTALCEKYGADAKKGCGSDALTKTLNQYIGAIVETVLDSNGDVIKFAGDAILVCWEADVKTIVNEFVRALKCAINIQTKCDDWDTEVGVKLRVKIGIAAGPLFVSFVGNKDAQQFVTSGPCIEAVREAEGAATAGVIVLSPKAWRICPDKDLLNFAMAGDGKHVKILSANKNWGKGFVSSKSKSSKKGATLRKRHNIEAILHTVRKGMLEPYVAPPVLHKIEAHQPLEYLCELREVSIVFINLTLANVSKEDECFILQDAFDAIYDNVVQFQGCLNKIFMFDKGCTFLAIFGLPGYKHENECAHALQCSHRMREKLSKVARITAASVGVTTGNVFTGVVGHADRHEYTVIGRKVNMAARLMMHYPEVISCDEETYRRSKLGDNCFRQLPMKDMKGVKHAGTIRQYLENKKAAGHLIHASDASYPLLGYSDEMSVYSSSLRLVTEHRETSHRRLILFEGDPGVGKSRVLQAATDEAVQLGHKVIFCQLWLNDSTTPYYTVKKLLKSLFKMDGSFSYLEREEALYNSISASSEGVKDSLCLLNDLLGLQLPCNEEFAHMSTSKREMELRKLLVKLVHQITAKCCLIFAIDDAHFVDAESWELLADLAADSNAVCVMAMRPFASNEKMPRAASTILSSNYTLTIKLNGLEPQFMEPLACQILDVVRVPQDLVRILETRSHGLPSWVDSLVKDLTETEKIFVTKDPNNRDQNICLLAPNVKLSDMPIPDSLKGMMLAKVDRLQTSDRMVVKCAAVIGMSIEREVLLNVVPHSNRKKVGVSIGNLVRSGLLDYVDYESDQNTLRFRTSMMQECAYALLTGSQRKKLHARIASFLEDHFLKEKAETDKPSLFKKKFFKGFKSNVQDQESTTSIQSEGSKENDLTSVYPQLIRHWRAAGNSAKTLQYLIKVGSIAVTEGHNMQAVSYLAQAKNLKPSADQLSYIDDLLSLALNWSLRSFTENKGRQTKWKGAVRKLVKGSKADIAMKQAQDKAKRAVMKVYDDDDLLDIGSDSCFTRSRLLLLLFSVVLVVLAVAGLVYFGVIEDPMAMLEHCCFGS